jgi:hypothetical protein
MPECLYSNVSESERVRLRAWRWVSDGEREARILDEPFRDLVSVMVSLVNCFQLFIPFCGGDIPVPLADVAPEGGDS